MFCTSCGAAAGPDARFCASCGARLPDGATAGAEGRDVLEGLGSEAERRQLTVLFCDLVGFTALSGAIDAEELRGFLGHFQRVVSEEVGRHEGHIAQYLGDGVLVYFGYPAAHEDDAQRAVRTGLAILAVLATVNERLPEGAPHLSARIGVHTGPVVIGAVGGGARQERLALGETPNVAARTQHEAAAGTMVLTSATHHLVAPYFELVDLGLRTLKGVQRPLGLYQVIGETGVRSRMDIARLTGLTPLVGRDAESERLLAAWREATSGKGRALLLRGEPGIGKSRQTQALRERLEGGDASVFECRCSPYLQNSSFAPVLDALQRYYDLGVGETPEARLDTIVSVLRRFEFPLTDSVPLLAALLSVPGGSEYPAPDISPQLLRFRTMALLTEWLVRLARERAVLLIVEDLHWADPSSIELLGVMIPAVASERAMILLTSRPELEPPWGPEQVELVPLPRLPRGESAQLVRAVTRGKGLPPEIVERVVAQTDGVPLFLEELTKMMLESGILVDSGDHYELAGPIPDHTIPVTIQDSLMARLDRLGPARTVAQVASALGREFRHDVLAAVTGMEDAPLNAALARLLDSGLVLADGSPPQPHYVFNHALVQDAAYQSLLKSTRQQVHERTASLLIERFPDTAANQPELVAHHSGEAGLHEQAIRYWLQAGERAVWRSANLEAIAHLRRGLAQLEALPQGSTRDGHELSLQLVLGVALRQTFGYSHPDVETTHARARELCETTGNTPQMGPVLYGLFTYYISRAEYSKAREMSGQLVRLGESLPNDDLLMQGRVAHGDNHFWGYTDFAESRRLLTLGRDMYDLERHRHHALVYGQDPGVISRLDLSLVLQAMGDPDQALEAAREALALARRRGDSFTITMAYAWGATLGTLRLDPTMALEWGRSGAQMSEAHGYALWLLTSSFSYGWGEAVLENPDAGIGRLHFAMQAWAGAGAGAAVPFQFGVLADLQRRAGRLDEALAAAESGLAVAARSHEGWYEAELHRLRGEILLASGAPHADVDAAYRAGLELARAQKARTWELRTALSLARLRALQGREEEGRTRVAEVFSRFVEGFGAPDLVAAAAYLGTPTPAFGETAGAH